MRGDDEPSEASDEEDVRLADEVEAAEELDGKLASNPDEERLAHSILENDEQSVEDGKVVEESYNRGIGAFTPDRLFENLVSEYQNADRLYGETLVRALTGWSPGYIEKNVKIPEFQEALRQRIEERVAGLQDRDVLDQHGLVTDAASKLAALVMAVEELDHLETKGPGTLDVHEHARYGEKADAVPFKRGVHRYRDVALKRSIRKALRRGHETLHREDLQAFERRERGLIQVIYAMDASGSMRGEKLRMAKRAGVALSYKAITELNEAGLIVFSSHVEAAVAPTNDFKALLSELVKVRASMQTDLAATITESLSLFNNAECTKHLVLLTDAMPTQGEDPRRETLEAAGVARAAGVTISVVGVNLDAEGESLARELVSLGDGRLYKVTDVKELDTVLLTAYDAVAMVGERRT